MLPTPASGCPVTHWRFLLPEIRPDHRVPGSILSRYSTVTTCFGGFRLRRSPFVLIAVMCKILLHFLASGK